MSLILNHLNINLHYDLFHLTVWKDVMNMHRFTLASATALTLPFKNNITHICSSFLEG